MAYAAVSVTTSATLIVGANTQRRNLTIVNDGSSTIYIGPDSSITTSNGIPLYGRQGRAEDRIPEGYQGDVYGIIGSGTADVRYWENTNQ
jgi:hypothetical protein